MIITFLEHKSLQEKLITFGKKAYPNVFILSAVGDSSHVDEIAKASKYVNSSVFDVGGQAF